MREPLFIVGMYKSGTSWLLRILSSHARVTGVKEIDLLKAGAGDLSNGDALLPVKARLFGYFGSNAWCTLPKSVAGDAEGSAILQKYIGNDEIKGIFDLPVEWAVDAILELGTLVSRPDRTLWAPEDTHPLQTVLDLPRKAVISLYRSISEARDIYSAGNAFIECVTGVIPRTNILLLKGADQIARYGYLKSWRSGARKLVIVRDGRDAVISAIHYRNLMRTVRRVHVDYENDYWNLLHGWASRIRMLLEVSGDEGLAVLRYEDLSFRFMETTRAMFEWLDLPVDERDLTRIQRETRFESLTGRRRGEVAAHVMRRGMTGEWRETLSKADATRAWVEVGSELSVLGYTRTGEVEPLNIKGAL